MKQDNGWFERGELPPAGAECEALFPATRWNKVKFMGIGYHGSAIIHLEKGPVEAIPASTKFRPIHTERDVLMDTIASQGFINRDGGVCGQIADTILAAGFSLRAK